MENAFGKLAEKKSVAQNKKDILGFFAQKKDAWFSHTLSYTSLTLTGLSKISSHAFCIKNSENTLRKYENIIKY